MTKRQLAGIYRRAAKRIDSGKSYFSCDAVCHFESDLGNYLDSPATTLYLETMQLPRFRNGEPMAIELDSYQETKQVRVLLLLLMADWDGRML